MRAKQQAKYQNFICLEFLRGSVTGGSGGATVDYTGCPKSHYTKVRAYCSACDHLICKISSEMFQKNSSFEEFNGFSEIDVHSFE